MPACDGSRSTRLIHELDPGRTSSSTPARASSRTSPKAEAAGRRRLPQQGRRSPRPRSRRDRARRAPRQLPSARCARSRLALARPASRAGRRGTLERMSAHDHGGTHSPRTATRTRSSAPTPTRAGSAIGLALIVAFMVAEVVAGILADSLALLSDAAHMLTDAGALLLSLIVLRLVRRPARGEPHLRPAAHGGALGAGERRDAARARRPDRLRRHPAADHAAGARGARDRRSSRSPASSSPALVTQQLAKANRESMNIEGSFQHILTDLVAFAVTGVAGVVILADRLRPRRPDRGARASPRSCSARRSGCCATRAACCSRWRPPTSTSTRSAARWRATRTSTEVHDLHVWEIGSGFPALSAHVLVEPDADCHGLRRELEAMLHERFGLDHTTLQVDHAQPDGAAADRARRAARTALTSCATAASLG